MSNIIDRKDQVELTDENSNSLFNTSYYTSLKTPGSISDPSLISSTSSLINHRYSDTTHSSMERSFVQNNNFDEFDIIDSLDFEDIDDNLIDQELLHRGRESIVEQLYATEKKYVDDLDLVINSFILPLRNKGKPSTFGFLGKKLPCTEREMLWLFGNFEDIAKIHRENLSIMSERLTIWGPTQIISDVLQTWLAKLQQQYQIYFDNYDVLVTTFERLCRYAPFKKFTESVNKSANLKGISLLSLLQTPVGCIRRYQSLLTDLVDNTSSMHPDYGGLTHCKSRILSLAGEFKTKFDDAKNVDKVYEILTSMTGQPFSVKAERRIYLQNNFKHVKRLNGEDRSYLLFSDILVFARPKGSGLQYKGHISLDRARVRALATEESVEDDWCIEIISSFQGVDSLNSTFMGSPTAHIIRTSSKQDQKKWLSCLNAITTKLDQNQQNKIMVNRKPAESVRRLEANISNDSNQSNA